MKKYIAYLSAALLAIAALGSCTDANLTPTDGQGKGKLSLKLKPEGSFIVSTSANAPDSKAGSTVNAANFQVTLYNEDGDVVNSWKRFSDMPQVLALDAGNYSIEAKSCDLQSAVFDTPYYYGKQDFAVIFDQLNSIELTCSLQCMKVTVEYDDAFISNFKSFNVKVEIADPALIPDGEEGYLDYIAHETRAGYFKVAPLRVFIDGVKLDDSRYNHTEMIEEVNPMDYHQIKLSIKPIGTGSFNIRVNTETTNIQHDFNVPTDDEDLGMGGDTTEPTPDDPDDPDNPGGDDGGDTPPPPVVVKPSVTGVGFEIDQPVSITDANIGEGGICNKPVQVDVAAPEGGIASLMVKITMSTSGLQSMVELMFKGDSFDLANLTPDQAVAVGSLNLIPEGVSVPGLTSFRFDVTGFMALLDPGVSSFDLSVTDNKGNTTTATLRVNRVTQ